MKLKTILIASLCLGSPLAAQDINYGTNSGDYAMDGECDDRRFEGSAVALILSWGNVGRDAQDCRDAVTADTARMWDMQTNIARTDCSIIEFGDNRSQYADDGACDDPRFEGHGIAEAPTEEHMGHDANDCQRLCDFDMLFLRDMREVVVEPPQPEDALYGRDNGSFANDGECDDRRFVGPGMASSLTWNSLGRDASDCRSAVENGAVLWDRAAATEQTVCSAIDFGTDDSEYSNDGTCDDYRFEGLGVASHIFADVMSTDATDCSRLCDYGMVFVRDVE